MMMSSTKISEPKKKIKKKAKTIPNAGISYHFKPEGMSYEDWQIELRKQFGINQNFILKNIGSHPIYSDFEITNPQSKKTYKIAIRSETPGLNFCSCPDFKINTLGVCKHIEFTLDKLKKKKGSKKLFQLGYDRTYSSVCLRYGEERQVVLRIGTTETSAFQKLAKAYFDSKNILLPEKYDVFDQFLEKARAIDPEFKCYSDAIDYILEIRDTHYREQKIQKKYPKGIQSPELDLLLKTNLYSYQKEGILFASKVGRSLIADDMGLGKTIQAIGTAELMIREFNIETVLIICPTSLKYQWKSEIEKFTDRSVQVIEGWLSKRKKQYQGSETFKIISYNNVAFDYETIHKMKPDLVILDEAQRIKNWKSQTAKRVKLITSPYAVVLTGTPLENRLEELYSIVEFIDRYKLGPLFRFLANHQIINETGKLIGYKDLNKISQALSTIMIRRTKKEVLTQLPKRIDKHYFVSVTDEQYKIHKDYYDMVAQLVDKWRRFKFLSEKDRQKLLLGLSCMRMVANSTYILDEETRFDTKIDELMTQLSEIMETPDVKVVIFSSWERMTRLVAMELEKSKIGFENLHGGVPSKDRKNLIKNFHEKPDCRVFLSTDAGSTGLNLQCANVVINLECPWNPAVLEQRIARVHRLGQVKPVQVIHYISKGTIEERILELLTFKKSVFDGVLDHGADEVFIGDSKLKQFMKTVEIITTDIPAPLMEEATIAQQAAKSDADPTDEQQKSVPIDSQTQNEASTSMQTDAFQQQSIQTLIQSGIQFLQSMQMVMASSAQDSASSLIEKDSNTGKPYLKIPIQEETIQQVTAIAQTFLSLIKKS